MTMRGIGRAVLLLLASVAITLFSVRIQRTGPEEVVYSNLCGPTTSDLCYKPVLNGGFPFAYLYDAPGISVEDQLAFVEDNFRPAPFILDVCVYAALILAVLLVVSRMKRASTSET